MTRRIVRATDTFFEELDAQLRPERGHHGEPSATDFLVVEMPAIVERFAVGFEDLPEVVEGDPVRRMVIGAGHLVRIYVAFGVLTRTTPSS